MTYRLADLYPDDVVHHPVSSFMWRIIHVEMVSRMFLRQIVTSQSDIVPISPSAKWSPPHTAEEWHSLRDGEVRRGARVT